MFCHTSLFTFVPCYDERDTITILKTYYFMKKNYLTELCKEDEEVEGSLLMLAKLLASKELLRALYLCLPNFWPLKNLASNSVFGIFTKD